MIYKNEKYVLSRPLTETVQIYIYKENSVKIETTIIFDTKFIREHSRYLYIMTQFQTRDPTIHADNIAGGSISKTQEFGHLLL